MRSRHPKLIFLDLGGVVFEINWKPTFHAVGITAPDRQNRILERMRDWPPHHEFESGRISPEIFFAELVQVIGLDPNTLHLENAWNQLVVRPLPGVERIFDLFSSHVPICALSNTNVTHYDYFMKTFPISNRFHRILTSFELKSRKPDAEIYQRACESMNVRPEDCVFFDDLKQNVTAAQNIGMQAFHTVNSTDTTLEHLHKLFETEPLC